MVGGFSVSRTATLDCIKYKIQVSTTICSALPLRVSSLAALPTTSVTDTLAWLCDDHPSHRLGCARDLLSELFGFSLAVSLGLGPFDRQARKREETFPEAALALLLSLSCPPALCMMPSCRQLAQPLMPFVAFVVLPAPSLARAPAWKECRFSLGTLGCLPPPLPRNTLLRVARAKFPPVSLEPPSIETPRSLNNPHRVRRTNGPPLFSHLVRVSSNESGTVDQTISQPRQTVVRAKGDTNLHPALRLARAWARGPFDRFLGMTHYCTHCSFPLHRPGSR